MTEFDRKAQMFALGLNNIYKDEDDRTYIGKLDFTRQDITEDLTAMLYGVYVYYKLITGDDSDFIGFTHICNRLAVQHSMVPRPGKAGEGWEKE